MKEITTKTLDFLELFKINPLFKGGVSRLSHPSLGMVNFEQPLNLSKKQKLFLDTVCKRFYTPEYKFLFGDIKCLDEYDKKYHSFMFYLIKNILPHLHFLDLYGTQCCEKVVQPIFNLLACTRPDDANIGDSVLYDDNNIREYTFAIKQLMTIQELGNPILAYNKKLTPNSLYSPIFDIIKPSGYKEFIDKKYPDELKLLIIETVNNINSYFFDYLYKSIRCNEICDIDINDINETHKLSLEFKTKLEKNKLDIAVGSRRGFPRTVVISEKLLNFLYSGSNDNLRIFDFIDEYNDSDKSFRFNCFIDSMSNSWIVDSQLDENIVLIGYKGSSEMDAGVFFAPYIGENNTFNFTINDEDEININFPNTIMNNQAGIELYFRKLIFKISKNEELTIGKVIDDIISLSEDSSTLNESKNDAKMIAKYKTILKKSNKK